MKFNNVKKNIHREKSKVRKYERERERERENDRLTIRNYFSRSDYKLETKHKEVYKGSNVSFELIQTAQPTKIM